MHERISLELFRLRVMAPSDRKSVSALYSISLFLKMLLVYRVASLLFFCACTTIQEKEVKVNLIETK